jgi:hypothetical protein
VPNPQSNVPESFLRAKAAQEEGRWADAEAAYRETLRDHPRAIPAAHNLVTVLNEQEKADEAEVVLREALRYAPDNATLAFNLGLSRLARGDYEEGLPLYEFRRRVDEAGRVQVPNFSFPEWNGQAVGSLLIVGEQGLGDQIQFARYAPLLRAQGVRVTFACHPSLQRLFEPLGIDLIASAGGVSAPRHDAWVLAGSLPYRFGTTPATIPPPIPIAAAPARFGGIGVAVRGNPTHRNDAERSLPPSAARELMALPGAISLLPEDTGARDFQDTADIVGGLKLVISVDTSVAHLAASMRKPTWVLLPRRKCDWRWMRDREDSPWYPTARLMRQGRGGDWSDVLERLRAAL